MNYLNLVEAKKYYLEGGNVTEQLRSQLKLNFNDANIIEVAYDLQAGSYIDYARKNPIKLQLYTAEIAKIIDRHITYGSIILDIGCGELTTLSLLLSALEKKPSKTLAFDISWSRIFKGLDFAKRNMGNSFKSLVTFVGEINEIPLGKKSVDFTISSHALEPNGGNLELLLLELFRVTHGKIILFEPCYEINSAEGKERMDKLGYIKNIQGITKSLGGVIEEFIQIKNISNPLNPTACFVIRPPETQDGENNKQKCIEPKFTVPGSNFALRKIDDFYFSEYTGLCYPILKGIPVIKSNCALLATALID
jgi:SAM-dependent methyltransferase